MEKEAFENQVNKLMRKLEENKCKSIEPSVCDNCARFVESFKKLLEKCETN